MAYLWQLLQWGLHHKLDHNVMGYNRDLNKNNLFKQSKKDRYLCLPNLEQALIPSFFLYANIIDKWKAPCLSRKFEGYYDKTKGK